MSDDGQAFYEFLVDQYRKTNDAIKRSATLRDRAYEFAEKYREEGKLFQEEINSQSGLLEGLAEVLEEKYGETFE